MSWTETSIILLSFLSTLIPSSSFLPTNPPLIYSSLPRAMVSWSGFLIAYFLGGVTFLPLAVLAVFFHGYYTFPTRPDVDLPTPEEGNDYLAAPGDDTSALEAVKAVKKGEGRIKPSPNLDVASGYFAVCREYTPMGINARPIERTTPVGSATVVAPSPSVYQSMYRSIFERKPSPVVGAGAGTGVGAASGGTTSISQRPKNAGNVFFVVLRYVEKVIATIDFV